MRAFILSLIIGFTGALAGGAYLLWEHHPERILIDRRMGEGYQTFAEARRIKESTNYLALYRLRLQHRRHYGANVSLRRNMSAEHVEMMREKASARAARAEQRSNSRAGGKAGPTAAARSAAASKTGMAAAFAALPPATPANLAVGRAPIAKASATRGRVANKRATRASTKKLRARGAIKRSRRRVAPSRLTRNHRRVDSRRPSQQQ